MDASADSAFLRISPSPYGDAEFRDVPLKHRETWLGRADLPEERHNLIDLDPKDLPHLKEISRSHAVIECVNASTYVLRHNRGLPIGLYELRLEAGQTHQLRHTDIFRLTHPSSAYWIQFFIDKKMTSVGNKPLYIPPDISDTDVYVFNQKIKLFPGDFKFFQYLYQRRRTVCTNEEIIAYLWPGSQSAGRGKAGIEQILVRLRKIFRGASGFGFIETIAGTGYRLMI